jgi:hypothetical protein
MCRHAQHQNRVILSRNRNLSHSLSRNRNLSLSLSRNHNHNHSLSRNRNLSHSLSHNHNHNHSHSLPSSVPVVVAAAVGIHPDQTHRFVQKPALLWGR